MKTAEGFKHEKQFTVVIVSNSPISSDKITTKLLIPFAGGEDMVLVSESKEESPRWVSVEKGLPKANKNVIVCIVDVFGESFIDIANYTKEQEWYRPFKNVEGITHWMPLPQPPEEKSAY